jgi:hypothetical protein
MNIGKLEDDESSEPSGVVVWTCGSATLALIVVGAIVVKWLLAWLGV